MDITFLAPCKDLSGGIKVIATYGNQLIDQGHQVTVVYPRKSRGIRQNLRQLKARYLLGHRDHLDWFRGRLLSRSVINDNTIPDGDIIIATAWETVEWARDLSSSKGEKFYFIQGHEVWNGEVERVYATYNQPFRKIAISSWLKELVEDRSGQPVDLVPNGGRIELDDVNPLMIKREYDVGMIYSNIPNKGSRHGLKVLRDLAWKNSELRFVMFSTDHPGEDLPKNISFHLKPDQETIARIYHSTRIWLVNSYEEGFSLPALEAMSSGAVVISTDNKGVRDIITDKVHGYLTKPGETGDMTRLAEQLLNNKDLYTQLQEAGVNHSRQFSWQNSTYQLETIFFEQLTKLSA